ncbi:hypothetical protein [Flexivirga oryzae]|uniref:Uncharacterized protein n=1 Tax=Flexivirga oryzae TaxID=1794944 RepID=A0A839N8Y8_9MICO|nr:hypothetical protein [Flexivirga oryzae]MBB2892106.1 hypothetical protein [Flexivirga oryzae]
MHALFRARMHLRLLLIYAVLGRGNGFLVMSDPREFGCAIDVFHHSSRVAPGV